jgi:hypothetical protein
LLTTPAFAVELTDGFIRFGGDDALRVSIEGPDLRGGGVGWYTGCPLCENFRDGDPLPLSLSGFSLIGNIGDGPLGYITFTTVTDPIPAHVGLNTAPFTITGQLVRDRHYPNPGPGTEFTGQGIASIFVGPPEGIPHGPPGYLSRSLT